MRIPPARALRLAVLPLAVLTTFAFAAGASADTPLAKFRAAISPSSAAAGATATWTLTVTNLTQSGESDQRLHARTQGSEGAPRLGSVNVTIPAGFTGVSIANVKTFKRSGVQVNKGWKGQIDGGVIKLRSKAGAENRLRYGQYVTVEITATAPCDAGGGVWTTAARNTNLFTGTSFALVGSQPATPVSGSCAVQLAFVQQPTSAGVDDPISPDVTVELEDAAGNRVLTDSSTQVTLAIDTDAGPGGTLGGTVTQTAVNGLATFSGLSIDVGGEGYTLKATSSPVLTPATSDPFDITLAQRTVEATPGENLAAPPQCSDTGDQTSGIPSCVGVELPNGANGPVFLATNSPTDGSTTANAVRGDFKDTEGNPLYSASAPAFIELEIDQCALPAGCGGGDLRALLGETLIGDYLPFRNDLAVLQGDPDLIYKEPRTGFQLDVRFSDDGALHRVPVCQETHDGQPVDEAFDGSPDGDEEIVAPGLFPDEGGACMAASQFDDQGDLHLFVAFFGDPRLYGH